MSDPLQSGPLVDALLRLALTRGYAALSLREIAAEAGIDLAHAFSASPTKLHILNALGHRLDTSILEGEDPATSADSLHDLAFDAVMRGFDAMLAHRPALRRIDTDLRRDPLSLAATLPIAARALEATLIASGFNLNGWSGIKTRARLGHALHQVYRQWLDDDDPGQARTMAELDRRLKPITDGQSIGSGAQQSDADPHSRSAAT
jgi:AcrR family transcriptional regulator